HANGRPWIDRRWQYRRPPRGQVWRRETKQPRGIERREVHATMASRVPESLMPEGGVEADGFVEKLNVWHVLDREALVVFRDVRAEIIHVARLELHPDAVGALRRRRVGSRFPGGHDRRVHGLRTFVRDERL